MFQSYWKGKTDLEVPGDWRTTYDKTTTLINPNESESDTIWASEIRKALQDFHKMAKNIQY